MIAIEQGHLDNFDLLLEHGANINDADLVGNTAATAAVATGRFDIVAELLNRGYDYQLRGLGRDVQGRFVPANSDAAREKTIVIQMLEARGVKFPVPPMLNTPTSH